MMHGPRISGTSATPYRAKALEWTGSALDHGGVARILGLAAGAGNAAAKHLARVACQDANSEPKKDPAMLMMPAAYPIRNTLK